jgi:hypothetical protein
MNFSNVFNSTQETVSQYLESDNACLKVGDYFISNPDNFKYVVLLDGFNFIMAMLIIRYLFWGLMFLQKKTTGKDFLFPFPTFNFYQYFFKKKKFTIGKEMINPLEWFYDLCLVIIEFRILVMIQFLIF